MTGVVETEIVDATAPQPSRWRRRRWVLWSLSAVVVLGLVGIGIGWLIFAYTYQPFDSGGASGPARARHQHLAAIGDGIDQTYWAVIGKPGTHATVDYLVRNTGSRSATVLGLPTRRSDYAPYITAVRWSNNGNNPGNGARLGAYKDGRDFPVAVSPGSFVFIQVTLVHPRCEAGGFVAVTDVPLRWSAMHVTHTWDMKLSIDSDSKPILVCAPTSALHHRRF